MALLRITNGVETFNVLPGAYKSIYKGLGFQAIAEESYDPETESDEEQEDGDDSSEFEELLEKPIAQWTKGELKRFAEAKGLDVKTMKPNEVREAIKEYLAE